MHDLTTSRSCRPADALSVDEFISNLFRPVHLVVEPDKIVPRKTSPLRAWGGYISAYQWELSGYGGIIRASVADSSLEIAIVGAKYPRRFPAAISFEFPSTQMVFWISRETSLEQVQSLMSNFPGGCVGLIEEGLSDVIKTEAIT
jgi:hypothetical protein